jgi:hypothetical protein
VQNYGKGGIVGHAASRSTPMQHPNSIRAAIGGVDAWISSFTKKGGCATAIDIFDEQDGIYVRSHYDGMLLVVTDAPMPPRLRACVSPALAG